MNVSIISDFNADLVSRFLAADQTAPTLDIHNAPYGQVYQSLGVKPPAGPESFVFVWTRPEGVVPRWQLQVDGEPVRMEDILADVETFAQALKAHASRCSMLFASTWVSSRSGRGLGLLDWTRDGEARRLAQMNMHLAGCLDGTKNVSILDSQRWIDRGRPAREAKLWYAAKIPFSESVCRAAARDVKAAIRATIGEGRKLIVLDLDNTLWGGIVGDDGWQNLLVGGHDPVGEAYADFQHSLLSLTKRGIVLAIVSKNDEAVALEAIDRHPEIILRRELFAGWRINWRDKAENLIELVQELNLGLQSVVFIDDNPTERGRVRESLPDVLVPDWPKDPARYADALRELDCFDQSAITAEDRARTQMYVAERVRRTNATEFANPEEWLKTLEIAVDIGRVDDANLKRAIQLANKTNQLNLRTRRFTREEFVRWLQEGRGRGAWTIAVSDRFGDVGLTGLLTWEEVDDRLEVVDYILSCRAMGRQIEKLMAALAVEAARNQGKNSLFVRLLPTARNSPCLDFWRNSGLDEVEENCFVWDTAADYPRPSYVVVRGG